MTGTPFGEGLTGWGGISSTSEVNQSQSRSQNVVLTDSGIGINCAEGAGTALP